MEDHNLNEMQLLFGVYDLKCVLFFYSSVLFYFNFSLNICLNPDRWHKV
jgi:hypothetical protein